MESNEQRNVQRIDGQKVQLHNLTRDELCAYQDQAHNRFEDVVLDMELLEGECMRRAIGHVIDRRHALGLPLNPLHLPFDSEGTYLAT